MTESWKFFWQLTADNCNCQNYILKQFFFLSTAGINYCSCYSYVGVGITILHFSLSFRIKKNYIALFSFNTFVV